MAADDTLKRRGMEIRFRVFLIRGTDRPPIPKRFAIDLAGRDNRKRAAMLREAIRGFMSAILRRLAFDA
jgi:hypothetical protein